MKSRARSTRPPLVADKLRIVLLPAFVCLVFLVGGASRADALSQVVVRLLALAVGIAALTVWRREHVAEVRLPLIGLGAFAILIGLQLFPLPPAIWTALPGREPIADAAAIAGIDQPWRPISLVPHRTMNSLLALLPAFAAVLAFAVAPARQRPLVLYVIAGMIFLSALVGLLQISTGRFYPYRITNFGAAVGLLANRNHQAALLALFVPMVATIIAVRRDGPLLSPLNLVLLTSAFLILPLVLATGSRAGIVLAGGGLVAGLIILLSSGLRRELARTRFGRAAAISLVATGVLVIALTIWFSRDVAVQRLLAKDLEADYRLTLFWPMVAIIRALAPIGAGFGTFSDVFKGFEPRSNLGPEYFNHAHNDLIEIGIEAGAFGYAFVLCAMIAWALTAQRLWRRRGRVSDAVMLGRLGTIVTLVLALASLADYPLRTPTASMIFVLGWCMMSAGRLGTPEDRETP